MRGAKTEGATERQVLVQGFEFQPGPLRHRGRYVDLENATGNLDAPEHASLGVLLTTAARLTATSGTRSACSMHTWALPPLASLPRFALPMARLLVEDSSRQEGELTVRAPKPCMESPGPSGSPTINCGPCASATPLLSVVLTQLRSHELGGPSAAVRGSGGAEGRPWLCCVLSPWVVAGWLHMGGGMRACWQEATDGDMPRLMRALVPASGCWW